MPTSIVAALQIGSAPQGKAATLETILSWEQEITASGAALVVMPEALLGGYPKGSIFGTRLGYRLPEGREEFARYVDNAIIVPGEETEALSGLSTRTGASLVIGVIERSGSTLYCTSLFIEPEKGVVARHRKLMPTGTERLIWGQGDGSTLPVIDARAGRLASAICWENHMPLLRMAMYGKGVEIWCAPTVDERDIWQCSMRHIAHEGRMFVVSACQYQPSPAQQGTVVKHWDDERPLINGGSVIVGPLGDVLAGPLKGEIGLLVAEINTDDLVGARYDFDPVGHYARPDIFRLHVDERTKKNVSYLGD
ncbi:carbon-nitrogen hydrolase family protein [Rouxiella chamberiensis]|uniref:carbon-nitrogen hydrolase family protein n=1 Tax=Rouxiella chamberiensis TaxID=1513468 RepID=UPI0005D3DEDA|nr:carbon-nitrogen hydrolase family protein [Rouxiella chamberiensis]